MYSTFRADLNRQEEMTPLQVLLDSYLHPRRAMDALAQRRDLRYGALFVLARGLLLALFFYLPFHLLKFKPITPAYLKIFDTPDYFIYAALIWPIFGLLAWAYLGGVSYILLRLLDYPVDFDQLLNLSGLLNLTIGIVLIVFDWLMVAIQFHTNANFMGIAHIVIADPWAITLSAIFYKKYFGVPVWLSALLGMIARILWIPIAIVFIRS